MLLRRMAVSKAQAAHVLVTCKCGCGETFNAFPVYRPKSEGGGLRVAEYKRGHHPNCRKTQTGKVPAWNAGMRKGDHPSLERMGFQFGNEHWNWRDDQNPDWFAPDFDHVACSRAYGDKRRSRGAAKMYGKFIDAIRDRDGHKCQRCGFPWDAILPEVDDLHVHHKVPTEEDPDRIFDVENVELLCRWCHRKEHQEIKRLR